jgi:hypothetical protein
MADDDVTRPIEPIDPDEEPAVDDAGDADELDVVSDEDDVADEEAVASSHDTIVSDGPLVAPIEPLPPDLPPGDRPEPVEVEPVNRWWVGPAIATAVLLIVALIAGLASSNDDGDDKDDIATSETTTTSATSSTTATTLQFTVQTTAPAATARTVPAGGTATTVATATTVSVNNRPMSIEAQWDPGAPTAGQEVVFTVHVSDPDAYPIKEGACGDGRAVAFGDGDSVPTSCSSGCVGSGGSTTPSPGSASYTYRHAYAAAGTYGVTLVYSSGACGAPYSSIGRLNFNIVVS